MKMVMLTLCCNNAVGQDDDDDDDDDDADLYLSVDHPGEELGLVGELDLAAQRDHVALVHSDQHDDSLRNTDYYDDGGNSDADHRHDDSLCDADHDDDHDADNVPCSALPPRAALPAWQKIEGGRSAQPVSLS